MKKILLLFIFAIVGAITFGQGITGTGHDFSGDAWNASGEICIVCHTPHAASATNTPLWNHGTTVQAFTPYTSATFNSTAVNPTGTSRLCLSCHDGTVGLEAFGGVATNVNNPVAIVGGTGDLTTEHPIAFDYTDALATTDGGLHPPTTTDVGTGDMITDVWLFNNSLECASCHDVHNKFGITKLLRKSNAVSGLCLTCHNK
jgi:predicted CXXCH cytochrome family protein